ncbi:MAG: substrate-binding domain-containing protein [Prevotella sp.]|nr:substrate-binding domain-containing protein [Prevotella sp.]MCM1074600.1 substrate-binding domain-containing protein [Ruminococcus sp.]
MKKLLYMLALCVLLLGSGACSRTTQKYNEGSAILFADEGFKSFMEQEREVFEYQYPGAYVITYYMSELDVINGLLQDSCNLGVTSKKLTQKQIDYIKSRNKKIVRQEEIAVDAIALIVNKANPVENLTVNDIKDIFSGKVDQWTQLAWDNNDSIKVVFDQPGSANVAYIEENFLPKGGKFLPNVYAQQGNQSVIDYVSQDKNAIGLISVSWLGDNLEKVKDQLSAGHIDSNTIKDLEDSNVDNSEITFTDKVKILKVRKDDALTAYYPDQRSIYGDEQTGKSLYPLMRTVYLISTAANNSVGHSFYSFVTGFIGQKILTMTGILPYHFPTRVVQLQ